MFNQSLLEMDKSSSSAKKSTSASFCSKNVSNIRKQGFHLVMTSWINWCCWKSTKTRMNNLRRGSLNKFLSKKGFFPIFTYCNLKKRDHLNALVIKHICQDLQPISLVEQKGFQNLVKRLYSKYLLPNRKTVVKLLKNIRLDPP